MKYLVTGASGFLGSHLCEWLLAKGTDDVLGIDSNVIGSYRNIEPFLNSPRFKFIEKDLLEWTDTPTHVDGIFHLASPTAPAETYRFPEMTLQVNTDATASLIEIAEFFDADFLFTSSVKVSDELTFASNYIAGKREGERICRDCGHATKVARLGNVYGPRMAPNDSRVIPTFCRAIRDGKPLSVWGDGQQIDSFCYVSDAIRGLTSFMGSRSVGVMEMGDPVGITIEELAFATIRATGKPAPIIYEQPGGASVVSFVDGTMSSNRTTAALHQKARKVPDTRRAEKMLNWRPQIPLEAGLRKTFEYYSTL